MGLTQRERFDLGVDIKELGHIRMMSSKEERLHHRELGLEKIDLCFCK